MRDDDAFAPSAAVTVAEKPAGLSRRQLLRAGAWAAPALVLATAAPAAAASAPVVTPPPSAVAVPGGGTGALPTYLIGATAIRAASYWGDGTYIDGTNPKRAGFEINVSGIPHVETARTVTMYFYAPTSTVPLNRPSPASWKWKMEGSNFSSMTAVYEPGVWRLTFVMPSWGDTSYAHIFVTFP